MILTPHSVEYDRRQFLKTGLLYLAAVATGRAQDVLPVRRRRSVVSNGLLTGLSAFWPLNEVAAGNKADLSGNGLTLTDADSNIAGTTSGSPPSNIGTWADFTVSDSGKRLSHADNAKFRAGAPFTLMCWFQPQAAVASAALFSCWSSTVFSFVLWTNGDIQLNAHDSGSNTITIVGAPGGVQNGALSNGTTYHIVVGFDGTNIWMQLNAGARGTTAVTTPPIASQAVPLAIGNYGPTTNLPVNGYIGHCAFWQRSLSLANVTALYGAGNPLPFAQWTT